VIRLHEIRHTFSDTMVQLKKMVFDSYLLKYIEEPVIDDDKLLIVLSILNKQELSDTVIKNYALSTMLIQIALDTHEQIMQASVNDQRRQLTVLAGDYYSGLYYQLLSEAEEITMIKALSNGIKEINEHKILIYHMDHTNTDGLMTSLKTIESSLFIKLSEYFKVEFWDEFIANVLFIKRLMKERSTFLKSEGSILFEALTQIVFAKNGNKLKELAKDQKDHLLEICETYLHDSILMVQKGIKELPGLNEALAGRIYALIEEYQPIAIPFAEEG
jgi:heptaprenyl diphosphate synthase